MTKEEIIDETVEFYSKNRRGIEYGNCVYVASDDKTCCAIGRCLTQARRDDISRAQRISGKFKPFVANVSGLASLFGLVETIDPALKECYHGHSIEFWSDIQLIHDKKLYWTRNQLTVESKRSIDEIKTKYSIESKKHND